MDSNDEYASDRDDEEPDDENFMDDDYLNDNFSDFESEREPSMAKKQQETDKYEVLTADQIMQLMVNRIEEVIAVVKIPSTIARILLNHFKWDKEKLMERYDRGDQDSLFAEVHVISPFRNDQGRPAKRMTRSVASTSSDNTICEICLDGKSTSDTSGMECGHKFCSECWCEYLTSKIIDEGMGQTISCAAYDCDILVDDVTVMKLIHDPRAKLKYQKIITESFVECNRLLRWCPAPDCGHAVKVAHYDTKPVTCKCGHTFCFACGEKWHDPVKCFWLKKWIKKCDDDSETAQWFDANTRCNSLLRLCPALDCRHAVQDTEPITSGCGHIFCFACGENWHCPVNLDGPSERRKFDDFETVIQMSTRTERSRAALERYRFYWSRYMNQMQSLKFENKLYTSVKMEEMHQHNMSWIEVQMLKKAMNVLCSCRQTLMYNYVFTFYLKTNNQSIIFKNNHKDLEYATEQLSEYLEGFISSEFLLFQDLKEKVEKKTWYCEQRRKVLLEHVHEGYEKDYWEYQEDL